MLIRKSQLFCARIEADMYRFEPTYCYCGGNAYGEVSVLLMMWIVTDRYVHR
jgi:hypothetical protein